MGGTKYQRNGNGKIYKYQRNGNGKIYKYQRNGNGKIYSIYIKYLSIYASK
jgi:hypothetical protein